MKKSCLICLFASLTVGCASIEPMLTEKINPYNKQRSYKYEPIATASCENPSKIDGFVTLGFMGGDGMNAIFVRYKGNQWAFLDSNLGLDMLIDGAVMKLKGVGLNERNVVYGANIQEEVFYHITKDTVEKISQAKKVQFRATGSKGFVENCLYPEQLKFFLNAVPLISTK